MPTLDVVGAYCGVEQLKAAIAPAIQDTTRDALILDHLLAATRELNQLLDRRFFPVTATNKYRWPPYYVAASWEQWLEDDLLSVSLLQASATGINAAPVTLTHYLLEPQHLGPPYNRIEVDLSSNDVFTSGPTPQQSIAITGQWGFSNATRAAGTLAVALSSASATTATISNATLIDQGDVLLIDSEAIFVDNPRTQVDTTATLTGNPLSSDTIIGLSTGSLLNSGEVMLVDAEMMLIQAISGNNATVIRGFAGTVAASHTSSTDVYAARGLTIVRGVNGTVAATHLISAPIVKYQAPANVRRLIRADAIGTLQQDMASWGRTIGQGEMAVEYQAKQLKGLRQTVIDQYARLRVAAI